jgi:hypothetical protein
MDLVTVIAEGVEPIQSSRSPEIRVPSREQSEGLLSLAL